MGKAYTEWPDINDVLAATDLKEMLESIEIDILIISNGAIPAVL